MKIGFDMENTVLGFPEIFKAICEAMHGAGHTLYCIANHHKDDWPQISTQLEALQINPAMFDTSLMRTEDITTPYLNKARMVEQCDFSFDDWQLNGLTTKPVFIVPAGKANKSQ